jgi:hypothetical protein
MVRYLMGCTPLVSTVFGLGWAAVVGPRMAVWMWTGLIAAFGVIHVHLRLGNLKDDYRGAVESVVRAWRPGEGIAAITGMPDEFGLPPVRVYLRELGGDRVAVEGLKEVREASDVRPPMHIVVRMMDYTARARERIEAMGLPVLKTRLDSVLEHWCVGR